ncbi:MAG: 6-bladed beta-propeller [Gemmatimonadota bacterium]
MTAVPVAVGAQQRILIPARDKPLADKPATVFSVGAEDGQDWELLSGVRNVAFDAQDNLYVLDGNNHRVLVFDPRGKFVRKISQRGEGPGELMAPTAMTVSTDGSIVVGDIGRRAFSIFKPDGSFVKNVLFEEGHAPGMGGGGSAALQAHPRGGVVARSMPFLMGRLGGRGPGSEPSSADLAKPTGEQKSPIKWFDIGTGKTTQLYELTMPSITPRVQESGGGQGERRVAVMMMAPIWGAPLGFGVLPSGGVAVVHEKDYRVKIVSPTGQVERVIERPIAQRKATEADQKKFMEARRESQRNGTAGGMQVRVENGRVSTGANTSPARELQSVEQMLQNATFEESIPVLRRVDTDVFGRIWASRTPADFGPRGPVDLIRADGTYIGTLTGQAVPDAVSRTGRAAYIERDELGVERVVVRTLPAAWR